MIRSVSALPLYPVPRAEYAKIDWYRAVRISHAGKPLAWGHSYTGKTRFKEATASFPLLYLAPDRLTALLEVRAFLGHPRTGSIVPMTGRWHVARVDVRLDHVVDLRTRSERTRIQTTVQELTGEWADYTERTDNSPDASLMPPAPTQQLGEDLYRMTRCQGFLTPSAANAAVAVEHMSTPATNLHTGRAGSGTTATGPTEDVYSPDRFSFHHRYHRYRRRARNPSGGALRPHRRASHIPKSPRPASRDCAVHPRCGDHGRRYGGTSPSRTGLCSWGYMRTGSRRAGARNSRARTRQRDTAIPREDQIGPPRQVLPVQAKPEPQSVCGAANHHLRDRIASLNAGHDLATPRRGHDVHKLPARLLWCLEVRRRSPQCPHTIARRYAMSAFRSTPCPTTPTTTRQSPLTRVRRRRDWTRRLWLTPSTNSYVMERSVSVRRSEWWNPSVCASCGASWRTCGKPWLSRRIWSSP